jgi:hypothetical protein
LQRNLDFSFRTRTEADFVRLNYLLVCAANRKGESMHDGNLTAMDNAKEEQRLWHAFEMQKEKMAQLIFCSADHRHKIQSSKNLLDELDKLFAQALAN